MIGHDRPKLRDLVNHVVPSVATKWYDLGLQLLDPKYDTELDIIEANSRYDEKTGCRKMFSKWLNTEESATWYKLLDALRNINLNTVASDIEQLLSKGKLLCCLIYVSCN